MTIAHRFSRRRDGSLRLKVTAVGDDALHLHQLVGGPLFFAVGSQTPQALWVRDGDAIADAVFVLRECGGPWSALADQVDAGWSRLRTRVPVPVVGAVDDPVLRNMVHARPTPQGALRVDELGIQQGVVRADVAMLAPGR